MKSTHSFTQAGRHKALALFSTIALAILASGSGAKAQIGTWSTDTGFPGPTGTTVTGSGNSATWTNGGTAAGNAAIVAPFAPITLTIGQTITLTGQVSFGSMTALGNVQFRFGVFDTSTPATSTSYKGYLAEVPNSGAGVLNGVTATGNWASGSGGTALTVTNGTNSTGGDALASGTSADPFTFTMSITDNGSNSNSVKALLTSSNGTTFIWQGTATDTTTVADANTAYNELGFFMPNNPAGNSVTFSNVSVSAAAVPEPATLGMVVAGAGVLIGLGRKMRRS